MMRLLKPITLCSLLTVSTTLSVAQTDTRQLVQFPPMMQEHMLANMRDHLVALNAILTQLSQGEFESAADVAESRLGMSSLESHGAHHMAKRMPPGMRQAGTQMHQAASRFALRAQEGDEQAAYQALSEVTQTCITCHAAYKIR